jgi:hypothetical protein
MLRHVVKSNNTSVTSIDLGRRDKKEYAQKAVRKFVRQSGKRQS